MGTKLNKTLGAKEKCPSCGLPIICVEKPASGNFTAKLQWQDLDETTGQSKGNAHYNTTDGKNFTCTGSNLKGEVVPASKRIQDEPIESVFPSLPPTEEVLTSYRIVQQIMSLANEQMKVLYPKLSNTSNTFGQIRCKLIEQILSVYNARNQTVTSTVTK